MIPVDRGKSDISAIRSALGILKDKGIIGIFPEGGLAPGDELRDFKSGTILAAVAADVDIIPVYIAGQGKPFRRRGRDVWVGERLRIGGDLTTQNIQRGTERLKASIDELKEKAKGGSKE